MRKIKGITCLCYNPTLYAFSPIFTACGSYKKTLTFKRGFSLPHKAMNRGLGRRHRYRLNTAEQQTTKSVLIRRTRTKASRVDTGSERNSRRPNQSESAGPKRKPPLLTQTQSGIGGDQINLNPQGQNEWNSHRQRVNIVKAELQATQ